LTCGVWGEIFTLVLGDRAQGLDFDSTATLHYSRAYFNASFIGEILLHMGLPPESLDFLTRGVNMTKPPLDSTWENLPGLTKLLQREMSLEQKFKQDYRQRFIPGLTQLANVTLAELSSAQLLNRLDLTLDLLHQSTYYSILAPISAALRQSILGLKDEQIDHSITPELASLRSLRLLAQDARAILGEEIQPEIHPEQVFEQLAQTGDGAKILDEFAELLQDYAYLSEVGTDISVPTWREQPEMVKQLFVQLIQGGEVLNPLETSPKGRRQGGFVQRRVDLKGRVTEVYSRLLAELRWTILALEDIWLKIGLLQTKGDIFFLELAEIRRLVAGGDLDLQLSALISPRRAQFQQDTQLAQIPALVYGRNPPHPIAAPIDTSDRILLGIPASHGQAQGRVKIFRSFQDVQNIDKQTILVVPYTDSGWAPILVQAGGLIAEAGGKLSHGAIVAREYGIPAVMDIRGATYLLQDGQQVRIDGTRGTVELL
jgi:pyruvate,water dikinase